MKMNMDMDTERDRDRRWVWTQTWTRIGTGTGDGYGHKHGHGYSSQIWTLTFRAPNRYRRHICTVHPGTEQWLYNKHQCRCLAQYNRAGFPLKLQYCCAAVQYKAEQSAYKYFHELLNMAYSETLHQTVPTHLDKTDSKVAKKLKPVLCSSCNCVPLKKIKNRPWR